MATRTAPQEGPRSKWERVAFNRFATNFLTRMYAMDRHLGIKPTAARYPYNGFQPVAVDWLIRKLDSLSLSEVDAKVDAMLAKAKPRRRRKTTTTALPAVSPVLFKPDTLDDWYPITGSKRTAARKRKAVRCR